MKHEKWTGALAALGLVSLASAAQAEEKATSAVSALTPTTIGGYVDTSAHWNIGTGNANPAPYKFNNASKADGFNLDVVQLTLEKALDEQPWSAGYHVDLWAGPDAASLGTTVPGAGTTDLAIRQAYIKLNTPIGNGLDWKMGVFDSVIGYESLEGPKNPNYTRSYGHSMEPQTHTGLKATYRFCDAVSLSAGVADTMGPQINQRANPPMAESYKAYMASILLTAPKSMGFLAGSTLFGGFVNGFNANTVHPGPGATVANGSVQTSFFVGTTLATPIERLKVGAAFDYVNIQTMPGETFSLAGYASFQATDKLSFHLRGEYVKDSLGLFSQHFGLNGDHNDGTAGAVDTRVSSENLMAFTATVQYDLWANVVSRIEFRWDHSLNDTPTFGGSAAGSPALGNSWLLAANLVYKF